jgi:hypothetical protein
MTSRIFNRKLLILSAVAVLGFGTYAFADWGMGCGRHGWMYPGSGWDRMGYGRPGYGWPGNLSEDQIKKLQTEHNAFFDGIRDIRQGIFQKRLELRSELAKDTPDAQKALGLQKEISDLKAQLGQKWVEHVLAMKKIDPDLFSGFMGRGRMGYGWMGPGGYRGYYPYPPYGGFRGGYGMGPGYDMGWGMMGPGYGPGYGPYYGMGPGMMAPGWYHGMGPRWWGPNYPQQ